MSDSIWHTRPDPGTLNELHVDCAVGGLGITILDVGDESISARMPVDQRTRQPYGLLHGGASLLLAETLGSAASMAVIDQQRSFAVGLNMNANHIRAVTEGEVRGVVRPIHLGRSSHVWEIEIRDARGKLACVARLTTQVIDRPTPDTQA